MAEQTNEAFRSPGNTQAVDTPDLKRDSNEFARAAEQPAEGLLSEFLLFLRENQAWWMVPILLALLVLGGVAWLTSSAAAPFIYPLF